MTKRKPEPGDNEYTKINRALRLRREFEAVSTEHTAKAWIDAENALTPEEFDKYMEKWKEGNQ